MPSENMQIWYFYNTPSSTNRTTFNRGPVKERYSGTLKLCNWTPSHSVQFMWLWAEVERSNSLTSHCSIWGLSLLENHLVPLKPYKPACEHNHIIGNYIIHHPRGNAIIKSVPSPPFFYLKEKLRSGPNILRKGAVHKQMVNVFIILFAERT